MSELDYTALTFAEVMGHLSANYKAQLPIKAKLKPLDDEAGKIKAALLPMLMQQGLKKTSTKSETVSITEIEGIKIDDVATFLKAVKKEGLEHMLSVKTTEGKEYKRLRDKEIPGTHTEVVSRHIRVSALSK